MCKDVDDCVADAEQLYRMVHNCDEVAKNAAQPNIDRQTVRMNLMYAKPGCIVSQRNAEK